MRHKLSIVLCILVLLVGCSKEPTEDVDTSQEVVHKVNESDYEMIAPFKSSPIRQNHGTIYRENDVVEVGRRLIDKSKEYFDTDVYKLSEGQLITESRYSQLMTYRSTSNPNGLMTRYEDGLEIDGVKLERPIFLSDIYEINFHKSTDTSIVDGISVALVMKRIHTVDSSTGAIAELSDEALFTVGQSLGIHLNAYLRTLPDLMEAKIYIGLYVQSSELDRLPDNYLPGHFIGGSFTENSASSVSFKRVNESWRLLSDSSTVSIIPEVVSQFSQLKSKITRFTGDETVSVVGKVFLVENRTRLIQIEATVGAKTFTELYGLGQYISQELKSFDTLNVPVNVNLKIFQNTRIVIDKKAGGSPSLVAIP